MSSFELQLLRNAFIEMVTSPAYERANVDRENGLEKHVILATTTMMTAAFPKA